MKISSYSQKHLFFFSQSNNDTILHEMGHTQVCNFRLHYPPIQPQILSCCRTFIYTASCITIPSWINLISYESYAIKWPIEPQAGEAEEFKQFILDGAEKKICGHVRATRDGIHWKIMFKLPTVSMIWIPHYVKIIYALSHMQLINQS